MYAEHYPQIPFCPWLLGTEFVEHFFGLARTMLPNFTLSQFLALVKHVMLRQRIMLSGQFDQRKERTSRAGYLFDFDNSPLTPQELLQGRVHLTRPELDRLLEVGQTEATRIAKDILHMSVPSAPFKLSPLRGPIHAQHEDHGKAHDDTDGEESEVTVGEGSEDEEDVHVPEVDSAQVNLDESIVWASADATRESVLYDACEELTRTVEALPILEVLPAPIFPLRSTAVKPDCTALESAILSQGKLSIKQMLMARQSHQSVTSVKSQRTIMLDPKFQRAIEDTEKEMEGAAAKAKKMTIREASHRVRLAQDTDPEFRKPKTDRELHWQETARRVLLVLSSGKSV